MNDPSDAPRRRAWRRVLPGGAPGAAVAAIAAGYLAFAVAHFTPAVMERDTAGYLVLAERIAHGEPPAQPEADNFRHLSHVWVENARDEATPKYTPGLPLLMALGLRLAGNTGAFAVSPAAGLLALFGAFLLFRLWMSRWAAVLGVFALATNPMFLIYTNYPLAHAANLCLVTWGMYFLWRWRRFPTLPVGLAAGACLGFAVLVRPVGALFCLPLLAALLAGLRDGRRNNGAWPWRAAAALAFGYALFPTLLLAYNGFVFGNPLTTGYALSGEQGAYSWTGLRTHFLLMIVSLARDVAPAFFALGLAGVALFRGRAERLMLALWLTPLALLYASYYWAAPGFGMAYSRFFISLLPALVGAALALLDRLPARAGARGAAMLLVLGVSLGLEWPNTGRHLKPLVSGPVVRRQAAASRAAARALPDGAVVLAEHPVDYYLGRGKRFDLYPLVGFRYGAAMKELQSDVRHQSSRAERLQRFYGTHRNELPALERAFVAGQLAAGRTVALLVSARGLADQRRRLGDAFSVQPVVEWNMRAAAGDPDTASQPPEPWGIYSVTATRAPGPTP